MSPPPAADDRATAVSAALTGRQQTLIRLTTPRLYRFMAGWPVASMLTELARMGVYDDEIAEFLAVEAPHLAGDPGARFAVIASRRIGPLIRRSVVAEILARRPHPPWTPPRDPPEGP